jgi:microcompartment protein CcmL/EutN
MKMATIRLLKATMLSPGPFQIVVLGDHKTVDAGMAVAAAEQRQQHLMDTVTKN